MWTVAQTEDIKVAYGCIQVLQLICGRRQLNRWTTPEYLHQIHLEGKFPHVLVSTGQSVAELKVGLSSVWMEHNWAAGIHGTSWRHQQRSTHRGQSPVCNDTFLTCFHLHSHEVKTTPVTCCVSALAGRWCSCSREYWFIAFKIKSFGLCDLTVKEQ